MEKTQKIQNRWREPNPSRNPFFDAKYFRDFGFSDFCPPARSGLGRRPGTPLEEGVRPDPGCVFLHNAGSGRPGPGQPGTPFPKDFFKMPIEFRKGIPIRDRHRKTFAQVSRETIAFLSKGPRSCYFLRADSKKLSFRILDSWRSLCGGVLEVCRLPEIIPDLSFSLVG